MHPPCAVQLVQLVAIVVALGWAHSASASPSSSATAESCRPERVSIYKVTVQTFWSRGKFPKDYPEYRPNAQFSKVLGRTHNSNYVLWRLGSLATVGVKVFSEEGKSDLLDAETQGRGGVFDEFLVPPIPTGTGKSEAMFFADGNHSKVSLISRIIPSPDWFIGIDSFDLCVLGKWVDVVTLEVDPTDAGTDNGFTLTAPNWATEPQEKIYRITSQYPNHPANSFYYPHLKKLPVIATITFVKMKEYELSQVFNNGPRVPPVRRYGDKEEEQATNTVEPAFRLSQASITTSTPAYYPRAPRVNPPQLGLKPGDEPPRTSGNDALVVNSIQQQLNKQKSNNSKSVRRRPRPCRVGEWSEWSSCSRSCGIGEKRRMRTVLKHARRGGRPCPNLVETSWCGSARCASSSKTYFDW